MMLKSMTLLLFLAAAVTKDMQTYRIPNCLLAAGAINGFLLCLYEGSRGDLLDSIFAALLPIVLCGGLFVLSMLGAADIKLLMVVGLYVGTDDIIKIMFLSCLIGAVMALVKMVSHGLFIQRGQYLMQYIKNVSSDGKIKPYIQMETLNQGKFWLIHMSVPVLLAVLVLMLMRGC